MKPKQTASRASKRARQAGKSAEKEVAGTPRSLPRRMAMSILGGLPTTIPISGGGSSPIDILTGGTGTVPPTDATAQPVIDDPSVTPVPTDPGAAPGDINQDSPLNQATTTNVNSTDTQETATVSQQVTPIQQGNP
jgi:hypothetical protein